MNTEMLTTNFSNLSVLHYADFSAVLALGAEDVLKLLKEEKISYANAVITHFANFGQEARKAGHDHAVSMYRHCQREGINWP